MNGSKKEQDPFLKRKTVAWNKNLFLKDLAVKHLYQLANKVKQKTLTTHVIMLFGHYYLKKNKHPS